MLLTFEDRPSDSPFVERIWRSRSAHGGLFLSVAASHFEIAVTRHQGRTFLTVNQRPQAVVREVVTSAPQSAALSERALHHAR